MQRGKILIIPARRRRREREAEGDGQAPRDAWHRKFSSVSFPFSPERHPRPPSQPTEARQREFHESKHECTFFLEGTTATYTTTTTR